MGEVYQATDTNLKRSVAIKVLPASVAGDAERLARFQRDAEVLAALNHPNIAQIHGLEKSAGTIALVMELVEGPTLADRIAQGAVPVDEALPIAKQIAEALEAAHEQGIIHRDLKPANVKVRPDGTVKVLDFGLAKALEPTGAMSPGMSQAPTITTPAMTQAGMILGTAAYMSPEQAKGRSVDKRSDVWAFGAVLYEMLTGRRAFDAEDVSETLAAVLRAEVNWTLLPQGLSPALRTFLVRCLQKDPKQRVPDIAAMRLALEGAFETGVSPTVESVAAVQLAGWRRAMPLALTSLLTAVVIGVAVWTFTRPDVVPAGVMRFAFAPSSDLTSSLNIFGTRDLVISPDGSQIVYSGLREEVAGLQLYLRPIAEVVAAPLRGTEGGIAPFISSDGDWVGFTGTSGTVLQKVSTLGGSLVTLATAPSAIRGASWGADDQIIFGTENDGLFRVSGGGGEPETVTTPDPEQGEDNHSWPFRIPGRSSVLFVVSGGGSPLTTGQLAVLDLDTGAVTRLGLAGVSPHYVSTGHLVYAVEDGSLRAVPFDVASFEVTGNPVPMVEGVTVENSGAANFSLSNNGRLVYTLGVGIRGAQRQLAWVDREGREEPIAAPPRRYTYPRISPDGTRVAIDVRDQESDIWIWDFARLTRLTFDAAVDQWPTWTPDGLRLLFASARDGSVRNIYEQAADGTGIVERLTPAPHDFFGQPSARRRMSYVQGKTARG